MRVRVAEIDPTLRAVEWEARVTVRARGPVRHFLNDRGPGRVQSTVAHDGHDDVAIVCYNDEIERFAETARLGVVVRLSGTRVQPAKPDYAVTRHPWELVFERNSMVVEQQAQQPGQQVPPIPCRYAVRELGRLTAPRADLVVDVVAVGFARTRAFLPEKVAAVKVRDGEDETDELVLWLEAGVLMGGEKALIRDLKCGPGGVQPSPMTSVHVLEWPDAVDGADRSMLVEPRTVPLGQVEALGRRGQTSCRVRAVLTWHSAVGAYDRPGEWTAGARGQKRRGELRLDCRLADSSGPLEVKAFARMASLMLGHPEKEIIGLSRRDFDAACAAPLYRPIEWTLELRASPSDDTIYVNVSDALLA